MDKGRTLMEQACISKNIRGFAFMTVIHLINRLPTRTLSLKSLIEILEKLFPIVRLRMVYHRKYLGVRHMYMSTTHHGHYRSRRG